MDWKGHPVVSECPVKSLALAAALSSWRVLFLTDCHTLGLERLETEVLAQVAALRPNLLLFGGDYLKSKSPKSAAREVFGRLCRDVPSFGVLGNNDYEYSRGLGSLTRQLSKAGMRLLRNEAVLWPPKSPTLAIAGVDDVRNGRPDLGKALASVPEQLPVLLLSHSPMIVLDPRVGRVDLILAGHTHGGQIRIPFLLRFFLKWQGYPLVPPGLDRQSGTDLYVSRGVGTTGFRMRFRCPPELTRLRPG